MRKIALLFCFWLMPLHVFAKEVSAIEIFEKIKSLQGDWVKQDTKASGFVINFETLANGSLVVETWLKNDRRHSLTVYHMDGDSLMATHYCPQGNQPRLTLTGGRTIDQFSFDFHDVSNLLDTQSSHQIALGFEFNHKNGSVKRSEVYRENGKNYPSSIMMVKK